MITYAQNFEDVMIARAFEPGYRGFYVDIGAGHPEFLSVTCHFYNNGWTGINVEPSSRLYPLLCSARPNDINLQTAVGMQPGRATFYEVASFAENSTLERDIAERLACEGQVSSPREVDVIRLVDLFDQYVGERIVDFLKIDVEGGELGVVRSGDWQKYRPRLVIVEATAVNSREDTSAAWEAILIDAEYHKVWFDGLNKFYLRAEDIQLREAYQLPPNIFDGFVTAELALLRETAESLRKTGESLRETAESLREQLIDREAARLIQEDRIAELERKILDLSR